ncbi:hypothetical protein CMI45_02385 [Candidatus Pacearchaeota archaeon]|jgi:FMN phosphatase YigB (HAD superfamily)|nr:hypothetical protein [Candidatus Pacearchaeota archaeon]|tara:strand:+ start:628 stop:1089 length:462 start_codon:yes stop_codon:yes gene_type:complete
MADNGKIKAIVFDWIGTLYERDVGLFSWSTEIVGELTRRKYDLALISAAPDGNFDGRMNQIQDTGISRYFDTIVVDITKTQKIFDTCIRGLGYVSEEVAVVDDIATKGIRIGKQLGCTTFWIQKGDRSHLLPNEESGEPDYKIDDVREVLKIL